MKTILVVGIIAIGIFIYPVMKYVSITTEEITISDKERITTGSGNDMKSKFLVYTENEVFENTDALMVLKFNSADVQNHLKTDSTYTVKVMGWRVPFLSMYRNIITIK